jgi:hypothetical protein
MAVRTITMIETNPFQIKKFESFIIRKYMKPEKTWYEILMSNGDKDNSIEFSPDALKEVLKQIIDSL